MLNKIKMFIKYVLDYNKYHNFLSIRKDNDELCDGKWHSVIFSYKAESNDEGFWINNIQISKD